MIKAVVLDFDGTTADTMPTLEKIAVKLLRINYKLNKKTSQTMYRSTTGLPFIQQIKLLFPNNPKNEFVVSQFEKEKIENVFNLPLFHDTNTTIDLLREKGFIVVISSSTIQPTIEKYCQMKKLQVDQILGYREGFEKGKDHFNFILKKFNLKPDELLYVGDSLKDCERAQESQILFIAKIGLFSLKEFNEISKSKLAITNLIELVDLITKINSEKFEVKL